MASFFFYDIICNISSLIPNFRYSGFCPFFLSPANFLSILLGFMKISSWFCSLFSYFKKFSIYLISVFIFIIIFLLFFCVVWVSFGLLVSCSLCCKFRFLIWYILFFLIGVFTAINFSYSTAFVAYCKFGIWYTYFQVSIDSFSKFLCDFLKKLFVLPVLGLPCCAVFFLAVACGGYSGCGVWVSHCSGFSCCGHRL